MKIKIENPVQRFKHDSLHRILLAVLLFFISLRGSAQVPSSLLETDRGEITITENYSRAEVAGNITIVLTNGPAALLLIQGTPEDLASIKTTVTNGKLVIDALKKKSLSKLTVYLSATGISSLTINGDSEIFSSGKIRTNDLEIQLNGSSLVGVFHEGKLRITPGEEYFPANEYGK